VRPLVAAAIVLASSLPALARAESPRLLPDRLTASPCMTVSNGADLACALDATGAFRPAPSPLWPAPESYVATRSARVERDILKFFDSYSLESMRARDRLLLYGDPYTLHGTTDTLYGVGVFSAVVVGAAHAPRPLRFLFDRRLHVGPAIFDGGGMGAGFGGHL
jgi:hypothetical protein